MVEKTIQLTPQQQALATNSGRLFLEGAAGTGKTTVAIGRLLHLIESGVPASEILVLVPQRVLALPYHHALRSAELPPGGEVTISTMSGITLNMIELFWPLIAKNAGFSADVPPTFLSLETCHFYAYAPSKLEYPIIRFAMEIKRQLDVLDKRLAQSEYLGGPDYTIADIAVWPWYGALAKGLVYDAGEFLQVQQYTNVQRWNDQIAKRPAVKRGRMVNRTSGEPSSQLRERHDASDFDTRTADKLDATAKA